ncbi:MULTISPECIES: MOSC domain-containing protein [Nocardia]|uniref:MOSC domain-containing protein n=1 Tax=Nocardia TaxID=1817 RepID=UPI0018931F29|nr:MULTISPECIES: MOSC N-terminal beta barrel domain-containing protein [Nocardia]MBF6352465.1 MOSC domain-containing protein [Nocardia flavorosea]
MQVTTLRRYPVKSMLGEDVSELVVDESGAFGDRALAVIDTATGRVATAKQPRSWRQLLQCSAAGDPGRVHITLPDGRTVEAGAGDTARLLSGLLERDVRLADQRVDGIEMERADPDEVLARGIDAASNYVTGPVASATPGTSFVDYAPLHLITTATLDRLDIEAVRYRPNLIVTTPAEFPPYGENDWVGKELSIGEVRLSAITTTPRCAVPTLEHGDLPRAPEAVRRPMAENRVAVAIPGRGALPCAGVYLTVLQGGTIGTGDRLVIH